MPTDFRISDLPTSIPFNNLDIMEVSQVDSNSPSGYSSVQKTMEEIGEKLNNDIQYASGLSTTNKKIIGAINELDDSRNYSSTETAVGSWIDDSVIYRKVVTGLSLTSTANTWVDTTVNASNIASFIKGLVIDSSGQSFSCSLGFSNSKVAFNMPLARSNLTTIIIDYTKT